MASEMSNENNTKELQKIEGENVAQAGANEIESLMPKHDNCCHGHHHKKHWKIGKFGQGPLQFPLMLPPSGGTTPPDIGK